MANGREETARGLGFFFISKPNRFGSGWPVQAHQNQKPNRTGYFSKYFNRFNRFFLPVRFFQLFFFQFSQLNQFFGFFAHSYDGPTQSHANGMTTLISSSSSFLKILLL
jgi:hypothetical protein